MKHQLKFSALVIVFAVATSSTASEAKLTVKEAKAVDKPATVAKPATTWPKYGNVFYRNQEGAFFLDPVCGKYGLVGETTPNSDVAGKQYCFDADACRTKFDKDSPKYLAGFVMPTRVVSVNGQKVTVVDPVNNAKVELKKGTPFNDYMSKRYYFSADSTAKIFGKDPAKYGINSKLKKLTQKKAG